MEHLRRIHEEYEKNRAGPVGKIHAAGTVMRRTHEMTNVELRSERPGGSWAIGDLIFENSQAEKAALRRYNWLEDEHFARVQDLRPLLEKQRMPFHANQLTPVTWVVWATKPAASDAAHQLRHSAHKRERKATRVEPDEHVSR